MDWQAERACLRLADTGQITVVVQDNGSLHTSGLVQTKWLEWQEKGCTCSSYLNTVPK
jgi:hypothetical protein